MEITGKTMIFGVIGDPIAHTLSPLMQNSAIAAMGIDAVYVPFRVKPDDLKSAIQGLVSLGVRGLNVTVPHKTAIMKYCDSLTEVAQAVGAVNTITIDNGILHGDNTDVGGFETGLLRGSGLDSFPAHVCILGAGGAARGVAYACAMREEVAEIIVCNRTFHKAERLAEELSQATGKRLIPMPAVAETFARVLPESGLVVNTTSVGMHPDTDRSPVPNPELFHPGQVACDIIYNPLETRFLRDAASHGAKTVSGLAMLAYQGARALSMWTGREAPSDVMLEALKSRMIFGDE